MQIVANRSGGQKKEKRSDRIAIRHCGEKRQLVTAAYRRELRRAQKEEEGRAGGAWLALLRAAACCSKATASAWQTEGGGIHGWRR